MLAVRCPVGVRGSTRNALRLISGGAHGCAATQAELDATDDVVAALARWSAVRDQPRPALAQEAT